MKDQTAQIDQIKSLFFDFAVSFNKYMQQQIINYHSIIQEMKRDIDFTITNLNGLSKIMRPSNKSRKEQSKKEVPKSSSFEIKKSFQPQQKSEINEQLLPEMRQLKQFLKKKAEQQKKINQMLAEGIIEKKDLIPEQKKQQKVNDNVKVDQAGRMRDQHGNLLFVENKATQLLINKKKDYESQVKQLAKKQKMKFHQKLGRNFFDKKLFSTSKSRKFKKKTFGLQFLQEGSYQAVFQENSNELDQTVKLQDALIPKLDKHKTKIIKKRARVKLTIRSETPNIEWWDKNLLRDQTKYPQFTPKPQLTDILKTEQLQEPVRYQKVGEQKQEDKVVIPMYLTKDQRKKLRRKRKKQQLQQKNDKIKLGIIKPEKPKLKIANMAVVMKDQFIMDPSKVQAIAKKQMEERLSQHLQANQSRKLTKNQRKQKVIRKLKRDSAVQCKRVYFKLKQLEDPSQIFKVNTNAKQLALNGFLIRPAQYHRQPVLIAIQGGAKAVKFYKNLMLNRIHWEDINPENHCKLVWEGTVQNTTFGKWRTYEVNDEPESIRILTQKGVANLWDYFLAA